MENSNKLFLTGATGSIGGAILENLDLSKYSQVTLLVRDKKKLPEKFQKQCHVIEGDIYNLEFLASSVRGHNLAVHNVFESSKAAEDPKIIQTICKELTETGKTQPSLFIYTSGLYSGGLSAHPGDIIHEESEKKKHCEWDRYPFEQVAFSFQSKQLHVAVIRPAWVYGNHSHVDAWVAFCKAQNQIIYVKNQHARICHVHAADLGALYSIVLEKRLSGVFNGVDQSTELKELLDKFSKDANLKIAEPIEFKEAFGKYHQLMFFSMRDDFMLNGHGKRSREAGWNPKHHLLSEIAHLA